MRDILTTVIEPSMLALPRLEEGGVDPRRGMPPEYAFEGEFQQEQRDTAYVSVGGAILRVLSLVRREASGLRRAEDREPLRADDRTIAKHQSPAPPP